MILRMFTSGLHWLVFNQPTVNTIPFSMLFTFKKHIKTLDVNTNIYEFPTSVKLISKLFNCKNFSHLVDISFERSKKTFHSIVVFYVTTDQNRFLAFYRLWCHSQQKIC